VNNVWLCLLVSLLFILTKRYDMDIGHKQVKDNRGMRVDQQVERDKDIERDRAEYCSNNRYTLDLTEYPLF